MKFIIGLGNKGSEYQKTRHNIGEHIVSEFTRQQGEKLSYDKYTLSNSTKFLGNTFAVPELYMNESGKSVAKMFKEKADKGTLTSEGCEYQNLLIVRDDIDLPIGNMRLVFDSGSGGHNGIESIQSHLGSKKYWQLKIGVSPEVKPVKAEVVDFVLGKFRKEEWGLMEEVTKKAIVAIADFLKK